MAEKVKDEAPVMVSNRIRQHFERRLGELREDRLSWDTKRRDAARYILPEYDAFDRTNQRNRGDANFSYILDATGTEAIQTAAEGIMNGACNRARDWFRLVHPNREKARIGAVRQYMHECTQLMLEKMGQGNYYPSRLPLFREYLTFGDGAAFGDSDPEDALCWYNFVPGEYSLGVDAKGRVTMCYRELTMTVGQLADKFGKSALSPHLQKLLDESKTTLPVDIVHAIEPVDGRPELAEIDRKMPTDRFGNRALFRSVYWERGRDKKDDRLLRVRGYFEFPIAAPRLNRKGHDTYGYGLGMGALLGDIKQLQHLVKKHAQIIDIIADPPKKSPASLEHKLRGGLLPGGIVFYPDNLGQDSVEPVYQITWNTEPLLQEMERLRGAIRSKSYADAFTLFSMMESKNDLRVDQVAELQEEKLTRMGAVFLPLENDVFDIDVSRYYAEMNRQGMLPDPPAEIEGEEMTIEYLGIFAQAQRTQRLRNLDRLLGSAARMVEATQSLDPLDKLDLDEAIDEMAEALGTNPKLVVPTKEARNVRAQRQQMQQAAMAAKAAKDGAGAAQALAQTVPSPDSYLSRITQGVTAAQGN